MKVPSRLTKKDKITRGWMDNLGLKAFALAASIVLFSLVHSEEDAQRSVFMDVVALLPPPESERMLISELPDQVKVTLRGSRSQINAIQRDSLPPVQIDLTDTNSRYFYFDVSAIEVPGTVNIVRIQPATVPLTWAKSKQNKVAIQARFTGSPGPGLSVKKPVFVVPSDITIRGPENDIDSIRKVHTNIITLDGLEPGKYERRVPLEPLPNHVTYLEDVVVKVILEILPEMVERTLVRLEIASVGDRDVTFRPSRVAVTLRGPSYILQEFDPEQLVPFVDVSDLNTNLGAHPLRVKLRGVPEDIEVVRISPPDVLVRLRKL